MWPEKTDIGRESGGGGDDCDDCTMVVDLMVECFR